MRTREITGSIPRSSRSAALVLAACLTLLLLPQPLAVDADDVARGLAEVRSLWEDGRYPEAFLRCREVLRDCETLHGPSSFRTAEVLDWMVRTRYTQGNVVGGEDLADAARALKIKASVLLPGDPRIADSLLQLGAAKESRRVRDGEDSVRRALSILSVNPGPRSAKYAEALQALGRIQSHADDTAAAVATFRQALEIQETSLGPSHPALAETLSLLSVALGRRGHNDLAMDAATRSLAVSEQSRRPGHPETGRSLLRLALALDGMGDYAGAVSADRKALEIWTAATHPRHPMVGSCLVNLGIKLARLGSYSEAIPLIRRANEIGEENMGPKHPSVGKGLHNIGWTYALMGDMERAEHYAILALRAKEAINGPNDPWVPSTLQLLAEVESHAGRTGEARRHLERAQGIEEKAHGARSVGSAQILGDLARLRLLEGDAAGAERDLLGALQIEQELFGPDHPIVSEGHILKARIAEALNRREEAFELALESARHVRRHLQRMTRALAERESLRYESIRSEALMLAVGLAGAGVPERVAKVWDEVIRSRTLVLDEMAARNRRVVTSRDPRVQEAAGRLEAARGALAGILRRKPAGESAGAYANDFRAAAESMERLERELAALSRSPDAELIAREAGLAEVRKALPSGAVLVSYLRYEGSGKSARPGLTASPHQGPVYLAFVLTAADAEPAMVPLGSASVIDRLVQDWRREAGTAPDDQGASHRYQEAGSSLRHVVWDPVADRLGSHGQVVVVPDGALGLVSLATLPRVEGGYLLEDERTFHYLSAEKDLLGAGGDGPKGSGLLAVGGVDFDGAAHGGGGANGDGAPLLASLLRGARPSCSEFRSLRFQPLPGSTAEVREISAAWSLGSAAERVEILTGGNATETEFKQKAAGKRALHLATHGFLVDDRCASSLSLAREADSKSVPLHRSEQGGESLLVLSGLALAGANHRDDATGASLVDDGILTAGEVAGLDLRGVEWVVLSACDTGVGPTPSREGVLGLRRSFQIAGAATVIMSLWPVGDAPARDWSRRLYEGRRDGLSTAAAMRQASLSLLRARRQAGVSTHPFLWGAFVAAGDWR